METGISAGMVSIIRIEIGIQKGESSVSYTYETAGIRNLEIDMEAAEVYVEEGAQTDTVVVHMYRGREQDYKGAVTADGTLSLAYHRSGDWSNRSNTEFVIELPSGLALSDVKAGVGRGGGTAFSCGHAL